MTTTIPQLQTSIELTEQENSLLFSAISLSSQEKEVSSQLKKVKAKVIALFESRFDTENTGTIAKLGESTIQVKQKAGKVVLTEELGKLASSIALATVDLFVEMNLLSPTNKTRLRSYDNKLSLSRLAKIFSSWN